MFLGRKRKRREDIVEVRGSEDDRSDIRRTNNLILSEASDHLAPQPNNELSVPVTLVTDRLLVIM